MLEVSAFVLPVMLLGSACVLPAACRTDDLMGLCFKLAPFVQPLGMVKSLGKVKPAALLTFVIVC